MRVMGLDTSKSATGWAVHDGETWWSGRFRCPIKRPDGADSIDGAYTAEVASWQRQAVHQIARLYEPGMVAIEAPIVPQGRAGGSAVAMNPQTLTMLHAVAAVSAMACFELGIRVRYVPQQTWRAGKVRGLTRADRRGATISSRDFKKAEARRLVAALGITARSDDEAEAVLIALWAWDNHGPSRRRTLFESAEATP